MNHGPGLTLRFLAAQVLVVVISLLVAAAVATMVGPALGGVPTSVIPTTIVLDRSHRPAAVFLREVTADDILDVALPLAEEAPAS